MERRGFGVLGDGSGRQWPQRRLRRPRSSPPVSSLPPLVSVRTVESHVLNACRKLGVATRQELATALGTTP